MLFGNKIRELRESKGLVLRKVAALLEIDTATLSKIELGNRQAKREYIPILASLYEVSKSDLEKLWLAEKIFEIIQNESEGLNALSEAERQYKDRGFNRSKI